MKSIITASLSLLISIYISTAQISINHTDMPVLNDTLRYSLTIPAIDPGFPNTGENFNWDFSGLKFQIQEREDYISLNSINPWILFLTSFSNDGLGLKAATNLPLDEFDVESTEFYSVYHNSVEKFIIEGFFINTSPIPLPLNYSQPDIVYSFPLSFGLTDSIYFTGYRALGDTLSLTREGYRKNEVDGWGEITTPLGTFESLRVKTTLYESDSLFWTSLDAPIVVRRTHIYYKWLAKGQKIPVLEAGYLLADEDPQNPLLIFVKYKDIYREPIVDFPVADFHADKTEAFIDEPIMLLNNSTPDHNHNTYTWTFEPVELINFLNGTSNQSIEPVVSFGTEGTYSVKLLTENTSGKDSLTKESYIIIIEEDDPTAVFNIQNSNRPVVWLTGKQLNISHSEPIRLYTIYDLAGRIIYRKEGDNSEIIILDTENFSSGSYILQFFEKENKTKPAHVKFVIP